MDSLQILWVIFIIIILILILFLLRFISSPKREDLRDVALLAAVIVFSGQLLGSFCGVTFPVLFGADISDYYLSCEPAYFVSEIGNLYSDNGVTFITQISATNLHLFKNYEYDITLNIDAPPQIFAALTNPVIKTGQSSSLSLHISPGLRSGRYQITIQGVGGNNKIRSCDLFIDISDRKYIFFSDQTYVLQITWPNGTTTLSQIYHSPTNLGTVSAYEQVYVPIPSVRALKPANTTGNATYPREFISENLLSTYTREPIAYYGGTDFRGSTTLSTYTPSEGTTLSTYKPP